MSVRIRITELMEQRHIESAYQLIQELERAGVDVSAPTVYRLVRADGALPTYRAELLEGLANVFGVEVRDLFEGAGARHSAKKR